MSSMLASDVNNPEFVGATNPDNSLYVEFYIETPLDQIRSRDAGKKVFQTLHTVNPETGKSTDTKEPLKIPFVRIMKPGDNTSIIETPVREDHKARWPQQWLYFQMKEGLIEDGAQIPGWKIEDWPHVNEDSEAVRNLKFQRFYTVEQIAGCSDAQLQRIGMGGAGLREAAKRALRDRVKDGISAEMAKKDTEMAAMRVVQEEQAAQIRELLALAKAKK